MYVFFLGLFDTIMIDGACKMKGSMLQSWRLMSLVDFIAFMYQI